MRGLSLTHLCWEGSGLQAPWPFAPCGWCPPIAPPLRSPCLQGNLWTQDEGGSGGALGRRFLPPDSSWHRHSPGAQVELAAGQG